MVIDNETVSTIIPVILIIIAGIIAFAKYRENEARSDERMKANEKEIAELKQWRDRYVESIDQKLEKIMLKIDMFLDRIKNH